MSPSSIIDALIGQLHPNAVAGKQAFVGLDGYIDRIQKVVQSQQGAENQYFATLPALADRIGQAAGKSAQLELVNQIVKAGGNAPIMAHALGSLGVANHCLGNFGQGSIHPVFQALSDNCSLLSLGKPAETNALEFDDGKLILSEVSAFSRQDWAFVQQQYPAEILIQTINPCQVVALVDWCNLPLATDVWQGILKDVVPNLNQAIERQYFFDLADPSKKPVAEIRQVVEVINGYQAYGEVTLGLNENEAYRLADALLPKKASIQTPLENICQQLYDQLSIDYLLVHPLDRSVIVSSKGVQTVEGRIVQKPLLSTGGGDNLNAGFCLGKMIGCSIAASAVLGMATSGAYVQNGRSPGIEELKEYLQQWKNSI